MSADRIIRAWKDETFREQLSVDELADIPSHPSGVTSATDDDLASAHGGTVFTLGTFCMTVTNLSPDPTPFPQTISGCATSGTGPDCLV
jgi:mersacidin/lichenicidin family type 2 lantibiotic